RDDKKPVRVYATTAAAIQAYKRGEIGLGQRVEVISTQPGGRQ
ncbi:unnamed protein product, partial [marine sediment metagenome]